MSILIPIYLAVMLSYISFRALVSKEVDSCTLIQALLVSPFIMGFGGIVMANFSAIVTAIFILVTLGAFIITIVSGTIFVSEKTNIGSKIIYGASVVTRKLCVPLWAKK